VLVPDVLHILGDALIPSSRYEIQYLKKACDGFESCCADFSPEGFTLDTTRWCDLEVPFNPPATTSQPDFGDISAVLNKYKGQLHPIKARAVVNGSNPSLTNDVDFSHISQIVDAYRGRPYPFPGLAACPSPCCPAGQLCCPGLPACP
jgi:hypothetical protein